MKKTLSAILFSVLGMLASICLALITFYQINPHAVSFLNGIMDKIESMISMPMLVAVLSGLILAIFFISLILSISIHRREKARAILEKNEEQRLQNEEEMLWKNRAMEMANNQPDSNTSSSLSKAVDEQDNLTPLAENEEKEILSQIAANDTVDGEIAAASEDNESTASDEENTDESSQNAYVSPDEQIALALEENNTETKEQQGEFGDITNEISIDNTVVDDVSDKIAAENVSFGDISDVTSDNTSIDIMPDNTALDVASDDVNLDNQVLTEASDSIEKEDAVQDIQKQPEAIETDSKNESSWDGSVSVLDRLSGIDFSDDNSNLVEMLNSEEWSFLKEGSFDSIATDETYDQPAKTDDEQVLVDELLTDSQSETETTDQAVEILEAAETVQNTETDGNETVKDTETDSNEIVQDTQEAQDLDIILLQPQDINNNIPDDSAQIIEPENQIIQTDNQNAADDTYENTENTDITKISDVEQISFESSTENADVQIPDTDLISISPLHFYEQSDSALDEQQPEENAALLDVQLFNVSHADSAAQDISANEQIEVPQQTSAAMPIEGDIEAAILNEQRRLSSFIDTISDNCPSDVTESLIYRLYNSSRSSDSPNSEFVDVIESFELEPSMDNYLPVEDEQ